MTWNEVRKQKRHARYLGAIESLRRQGKFATVAAISKTLKVATTYTRKVLTELGIAADPPPIDPIAKAKVKIAKEAERMRNTSVIYREAKRIKRVLAEMDARGIPE